MEDPELRLNIEDIYKQAIEKVTECCQNGNYEIAEIILRQLLACDPEHKDGNQILGLIRHKSQDYVESHQLFSKSLTLDPNNPDNYNNLALAQSCLGEVEKAINTLNKALELTSNENFEKRAQYLSNLSIQLRRIGDYEKAKIALKNAIEYTCEKDANILKNYAALMGQTLKTEESLNFYKKALQVIDEPETHVDMSYSYHLMGDLENGWKEYEYRYNVFPQFNYLFRHYDYDKLWKGECLDNKTIVVYCEQGLGDLIQFIRYIPLLKKWKCKVILHCQESCVSILKNSYNLKIDDFFTLSCNAAKGSLKVPYHDFHVSIMSLPYLTQSHFLGMDIPYLIPTHEASLGENKEFKIGICWAGSPQHPNDKMRSIQLKHFEEISKIKNVQLYGFQKEMSPRAYRYEKKSINLMDNAENVKFIDLSQHLTDLDKTSSLIKKMDLVISVDTMILHLSSALGVTTWGILAQMPDWRWKLNTDKSEWYPSLTLYRQEKLGCWENTFKQLEHDLRKRSEL